MKTIESINKKFDELVKPRLTMASIIGGNKNGVGRLGQETIFVNKIKKFYTQQILSLIEELEGKKKKKINKILYKESKEFDEEMDNLRENCPGH